MSSERKSVGESTLLLQTTDVESTSVRGFRLEIVDGRDSGAQFESKTDRCTVGFHRSCDLVLADPTVSRFHCELISGERGVNIRDLGSSNGTVVDGVLVNDAFLKHDSTLRLGRTTARFQYLG
ncbi:MAG: FHA domain-containing protein, partial [Myxococcota bacterium]